MLIENRHGPQTRVVWQQTLVVVFKAAWLCPLPLRLTMSEKRALCSDLRRRGIRTVAFFRVSRNLRFTRPFISLRTAASKPTGISCAARPSLKKHLLRLPRKREPNASDTESTDGAA
jgi:hypothetical protein